MEGRMNAITYSQLIEACAALGLDPNITIEIHIVVTTRGGCELTIVQRAGGIRLHPQSSMLPVVTHKLWISEPPVDVEAAAVKPPKIR
jgi:hypothetical protein